MYDEVYEAMEHVGVAQKLPEPMWVDEKQEITEEANTFGRKATHLLILPIISSSLMKLAATPVKKEMEQEEEKKK